MKFLVLLILANTSPLVYSQVFADFEVSTNGAALGTFRAHLAVEKAPRTCANFIGLASGTRPWIDLKTGVVKNKPYYDGLTFHRLIHNFVIQGGSRNGLGNDNPGFAIQDEFHPDLRHSGRYMLSMAKTTLPGTGGAQFFITLEPSPFLDDLHSVFGEVITGKEIIDGFANPTTFPTDSSDRPLQPIVIESVTITGPGLSSFSLTDDDLGLPHVSTAVDPLFLAPAGFDNFFSVIQDSRAKTDYQIFESLNLSDWSLFYTVLSIDAKPDQILFGGPQKPRAFIRLPSIDYSDVTNAPSNLVENDSTLILTSSGGSVVNLNFNGAQGGTWTDSLGGSGTLSEVEWIDPVPESGRLNNLTSFASNLPLGRLAARFSSPAGADGWTEIDIILSFHQSTSGWTVELPGDLPRLRQQFTWTP